MQILQDMQFNQKDVLIPTILTAVTRCRSNKLNELQWVAKRNNLMIYVNFDFLFQI